MVIPRTSNLLCIFNGFAEESEEDEEYSPLPKRRRPKRADDTQEEVCNILTNLEEIPII